MRTIQRDIVSAVIVSKDGRMLHALQNPEGGGVYPGRWGIIGGGVEDGESFRDALNREVLEESGIDISMYPTELVHESEAVAEKTLRKTGEKVLCQMYLHTYKVILHDKEADQILVVLDVEHTEYRWVDLEQIKELNLNPLTTKLYETVGYA